MKMVNSLVLKGVVNISVVDDVFLLSVEDCECGDFTIICKLSRNLRDNSSFCTDKIQVGEHLRIVGKLYRGTRILVEHIKFLPKMKRVGKYTFFLDK
jgi:hypothetical protein